MSQNKYVDMRPNILNVFTNVLSLLKKSYFSKELELFTVSKTRDFTDLKRGKKLPEISFP